MNISKQILGRHWSFVPMGLSTIIWATWTGTGLLYSGKEATSPQRGRPRFGITIADRARMRDGESSSFVSARWEIEKEMVNYSGREYPRGRGKSRAGGRGESLARDAVWKPWMHACILTSERIQFRFWYYFWRKPMNSRKTIWRCCGWLFK